MSYMTLIGILMMIRRFLVLIFLLGLTGLRAADLEVYFGTGGGDAAGIYRSQFNPETGQLSPAMLAAEVEAPGFLAFHPDRNHLYAVALVQETASVVAYAISSDGSLLLLNSQVIPDGPAAHIAVHPSGRFLLTAQYGGGSVALFPLGDDGRVSACAQIHEHTGASGIHPTRQTKPHPHWVGFSPDGRFAFVPDLGLDRIVIYRVQLDPPRVERVSAATAIPGGGPRHMKFSVDGRFLFLLNELDVSVSTFAYGAPTGNAELLATAPSLSEAMKATSKINTGSEVLVHPNGQYVYAANRGHDSVTAFQIDEGTGHLRAVDNELIRGAWPRNINIDASGRWLLAAGARSDTVTVFEIDPSTGQLTFQEGSTIKVPRPICILIRD